MTIADIYESITYFNDAAERGACILHWAMTGGTAPNEDPLSVANNLATFVQDAFADIYDNMANSDAFVNCTMAKRVEPTGGPFGSDFTSAAGGLTSESSPAQVALLISKYTGVYTKGGRGRLYIPFPADSIHSDGQVNAAFVTTITSYINALLVGTKSVGTGAQEFVCGVLSESLAQFNQITNAIIRPVLATQKRRRQPRQGYFA